ncbi:hypothetical protein, partial [Mycobacteroides abscessus]|uniref:hypothetical protein n=1 Tax=Mycobacteroides abscessus TaxID=36809 RepID=UPI001A98BA63
MNKITGVVVAICAALMFSPSANADPPPPGCARVPLLGLNPQILEMCDGPAASTTTGCRRCGVNPRVRWS